MHSVTPNRQNEKPQNILDQLQVIPIQNEHVKKSVVDSGALRVEIEFKKKGLIPMALRLTGGAKVKVYHLDGYGRYLYERIDGKSYLLQIVYEFMENEKLTFFEAKGLLQEYVRILMEKGLVVLIKK